MMKEIPGESIDMAITSPPYWGLRDYGTGPDQLGLEPTPELYTEHLTEIFNEVKRILKKGGTFWLNISDTYSGSGGAGGDYNEGGLRENQPRFKQGKTNLQSKSLCMIPERLAWSLIQAGWILRNKIIWYKPNGMPSSVTDRFSNRWEYIFLFSKSQRYCFDLDGVREPHQFPDQSRTRGSKRPYKEGNWKTETGNHPNGKNPGDVFEINTQPFPEAHFAVFPEKLCEKPIKAGCPEGGTVLDLFCGAGTAPYVAKEMKRNYIGIDIKQEYCDMCEARLAQGVL